MTTRLKLAFDVSQLNGFDLTDGNSSLVGNLAKELVLATRKRDARLFLYGNESIPESRLYDARVTKLFGRSLSFPQHRIVRYGLPMNLFLDRPDVLINIASSFQPRYIRARTRLLTIVHDIAFELDDWKDSYPDHLRNYLSVNTRNAIEKATQVVAVSEKTRSDIIHFYGLKPDKVKVIYNGYDSNAFNEVPTSHDELIRNQLGLRGYLLAVGTIQPRKNYIRLIRAFAEYKRKVKSSLKLVIVGQSGWLAEETIEFAKENEGIGVQLWGSASPQELPALYRNSLALVFPALYEGFGIPAVEAMACGIPVIGSESGSLGEIIGNYGLKFSPTSIESIVECLIALNEEPGLRDRLVIRSRERCKHFSWQNAAEAYLDAARMLLADSAARYRK
ncbi:MAG: glycosyltransferase family 4 protein [Pyrinomonadaceae bacterium]|nr:glycosyltransferase family 4 protein [Pyrinomonadaceae bacterium]